LFPHAGLFFELEPTFLSPAVSFLGYFFLSVLRPFFSFFLFSVFEKDGIDQASGCSVQSVFMNG